MFSFFSKKAVIDDSARQWLFDCFNWAIENLDKEFFIQHSELVLPNNDFYPGKVSSVEEMAQTIFKQTLAHAGMASWPILLAGKEHVADKSIPLLNVNSIKRGQALVSAEQLPSSFVVAYQPNQVNQPQDLIAYFSQALSAFLVQQVKTLPPGGEKYVPQTIDLVGCFIGFGVIFTNTAYQFRGGCGSCNKPQLNRQATLSEPETVYALALFCYHKKIELKSVLPHLKKHLRTTLKKSMQDIKLHTDTAG